MELSVSRSSVAMGDDCVSHDRTVEVDRRRTLRSVLAEMVAGSYLPGVGRGDATWLVATAWKAHPVALIAQQWQHAVLFVDEARSIAEIGSTLDFTYLAQLDPSQVLAALVGGVPIRDIGPLRNGLLAIPLALDPRRHVTEQAGGWMVSCQVPDSTPADAMGRRPLLLTPRQRIQQVRKPPTCPWSAHWSATAATQAAAEQAFEQHLQTHKRFCWREFVNAASASANIAAKVSSLCAGMALTRDLPDFVLDNPSPQPVLFQLEFSDDWWTLVPRSRQVVAYEYPGVERTVSFKARGHADARVRGRSPLSPPWC